MSRRKNASLPLHGKPQGWQTQTGFCAQCGSRLTGAESDQPSQVVGVVAGSLDDPSWFRPQMDIFTSEAQPWDQMDPAIPKYENYPPSESALTMRLTPQSKRTSTNPRANIEMTRAFNEKTISQSERQGIRRPLALKISRTSWPVLTKRCR